MPAARRCFVPQTINRSLQLLDLPAHVPTLFANCGIPYQFVCEVILCERPKSLGVSTAAEIHDEDRIRMRGEAAVGARTTHINTDLARLILFLLAAGIN